ncbi:metal ABC transporter permease [Saccharomonospora piscinae]|uniref:metal ABC transporter permease n=1 Tax=Saccharomonospora piscinae TaxID=687388 RepID=UPI0011061197|nr:metal ABC transporter permease [Saccharomonospora piscinae]TLW93700.1 metal ABC transporter permease [Saccharomonospora piscinae]
MTPDDVLIVLVAGLLSTSCAVLGSFLLLRRQALLPDAVSHAVLPGIVLVFLLTGERASAATVLGATAFGVACVAGSEWLRRTGVVASDAALALVFPALFSLGVLGIGAYASGAHIDLDSALFGDITFAPLRTVEVGGAPVPTSLLVTGIAAVCTVLFVVLLWRPLQAAAFDPDFAELSGLRGAVAARMLLVVVSGTAVVAFDSVGAVLVITFFVVPAATARLLTHRLAPMLLVAVGAGWVSSLAGHRVALALDSSVAGSIGLTSAALFALALAAGRLARRRRVR